MRYQKMSHKLKIEYALCTNTRLNCITQLHTFRCVYNYTCTETYLGKLNLIESQIFQYREIQEVCRKLWETTVDKAINLESEFHEFESEVFALAFSWSNCKD